MRVHVVINPRASQFARAPGLISAVRQVCQGRATVAVTGSTGALREACEQMAREHAELGVLCGGDGSYMAGVSALDQVYGAAPWPTVCLGPGGSASTVARNWSRLLGSPVEHVRAVLDSLRDGRLASVTRPTLRVSEPGGPSRVGFIFGTGLVSAFFDAFYAAGGGGYDKAARLVAEIVAGALVGGALARKVLSPMPCRLSIDGTIHPAQAFTLIVSAVVRHLGLHLNVTHRAGEDPERPHLVATSLGMRECGMQYGRVLRGLPLIGPRVVDTIAREFQVTFPEPGGTYVLDGDPIACRAVTVRAGPRIRVVSLGAG